MRSFRTLIVYASLALGALLLGLFSAYSFKRTTAVQKGYPGVGMEIIDETQVINARAKANVVPAPLPAASQEGQLAVDAYQNVKVLGHLTSGEFTRLMTAMTLWVAPEQGCAYCHAPQRDENGNPVKDEDGYVVADLAKMSSDELYTKQVARRMLQMTMHINQDWQTHVVKTGVTCYTCHRGAPVPKNIWYDEPEGPTSGGMMGNRAGQNAPSTLVGLASLPTGNERPFLAGDEQIRVISKTALPGDNHASIKQAEYTYGLMMEMTASLGVNCTYCHNTRSMAEWNTSPPQRATAWYGIRMVRDLNKDYLESLAGVFPANRLGPLGDVPKLNCATCHQGAFKPLLGVSMLPAYQVLAEAKPQPERTAPPVETPAEPVP